jgi:hypothetical protein
MDRIVLRLMCDERGQVSFLFGAWGAADRAEAIRQIEAGERRYLLQRPDGSRAPIDIVDFGPSKRLGSFTQGVEVLHPGGPIQIGA